MANSILETKPPMDMARDPDGVEPRPAYEVAPIEVNQMGGDQEKFNYKPEYTLGQAAASGAVQFIPSLINQFYQTAQTVAHPRQAASDLYKVYKQIGATGILKEMAKPYYDYDEFKKVLATDPARILLDVSTLAGGAGVAGKVAGASKLASMANKISRATDPVVMGAKAIKGVGKGYGYVSGAGTAAPAAAARAVREGGKQAKAFWQHKLGGDNAAALVERYSKAANKAKNSAQSAFKNNLPRSNAILDNWNSIDKALASAGKSLRRGMQPVGSAKDFQTFGKIRKVVKEWQRDNPRRMHTADGLHDLRMAVKNSVGDYDKLTPNSQRILNEVLDPIKKATEDLSPGYMSTLDDYGQYKKQAEVARRALGDPDKHSPSAVLGKLEKTYDTRSPVGQQSARGVDALKSADPTLPSAIAGETLKGVLPRKHVFPELGLGAGMLTGSGFLGGVPAATAMGAAMIPASPGALGYLSAGAGAAQRPFWSLQQATGLPMRAIPHAAQQAGAKNELLQETWKDINK